VNYHSLLVPKKQTDVLSARALNRAALERQLLLRRAKMSVLDAIEQVVALQAQLPNPPYIGLWTRLENFRHEQLTRLIEQRKVVRSTTLRATQHLMTSRDFLRLRPVLQPMIERACRANFGRQTAGIDSSELIGAGRRLVIRKARTVTELGTLLAARWPTHDARALAYTIQFLLPLVHVPPGGTWGKGGAVPAMLADSWLRHPLSLDRSPEELIVRYLAAFGPATVADVQQWSGLTGLRAGVERLRPQLRVFRDESGRELLDVPEAPLPDADTPAPVRFLPEYDNLIVAYADRTRVMSAESRRKISAPNGLLATVLLDGMVAGRWRIVRERDAAVIEVVPFAKLTKRDRLELANEGERLLAFTDPEVATHAVRFASSE
jgi:hypothetical protein